MDRRRVLQLLAAAPVAPMLPPLLTGAAAAPGTAVGAGLTVDAATSAGVSVSWIGDPASTPTVRALVGGVWTAPVATAADHGHGPADPGGRHHSAPVIVPGAEAYDVRAGGAVDARVHTLAPRPRTLAAHAADPATIEPIPGLRILARSNWTDVGRRDTIDCVIPSSVYGLGCRSDVGLRHAIVHHTVSVNTYAEGDVADLIWGIQRYHMDSRGWDDIAYNFVVDRFGRIWQAREGDILEPITGGHTTGLNAESVGVAVLGTFDTTPVPDEVVHALGRLIGWKLSLHGVDPGGRTRVRSAGGDYAEPGEMVELDNVSGHRDNQATACPGNRLYDRLDEVRVAASELVPVFGHVTPRYTLDDVTVSGWAIDRFRTDEAIDVEVIVDGISQTHRADAVVPGLAEQYPDAGDAHGFETVVPIDLDTRSIVVRVTGSDGASADLMDLTLFATFIDVESDRFFAPGVYFLRRHGLTTGTQPGLFEPMDHVTRGQMATFLHRFMDEPSPAGPAPFADVDTDAFYANAVDWLHEAGITTGTSPTTFAPDDFVTRAQMATFIWRMCGSPTPTIPNPFDDVPRHVFYTAAVTWMAELGITTGVLPTKFAPDWNVRRGEMATFLHRLATTEAAWSLVDPPSVVGDANAQDPGGAIPASS